MGDYQTASATLPRGTLIPPPLKRSITHEAIKTLGWPGMTMDFPLANSALAAGIPPGSAITFELVERKPDDWVITKLQAQPSPVRH